MNLTKFLKDESRQANFRSDATSSKEAEQILHLKRLLVTMKQHYEKTLYSSQEQLQSEQNQRISLQRELGLLKGQLKEESQIHEEEIQALHSQQVILKDLLKKAKEELKNFQDQAKPEEPDLMASKQRVEQLERVIPYLRERTEEANLETEQLREELEKTQKKLKAIEKEFGDNKTNTQKIDGETIISPLQIHREFEDIKRLLATENQESKTLECRYIDVLNQKIELEHQCKQLQLQVEHQSSNLTSFQAQLRKIEDHNRFLDNALESKEADWKTSEEKRHALETAIHDLKADLGEKEHVLDKYEQLKEDWKQLAERLEETDEYRIKTEQQIGQLDDLNKRQEIHLQEISQQIEILNQEKQTLEKERDQQRMTFEESENRLKVAQQHLAKKVKEVTLLNEKVTELQANLAEHLLNIDYLKSQLAQLQASVDLYQRQEKRLQEQLHDAIKGTESQVSKWEEKYFRIYEKWQESENMIRELKKFEEKHQQMQSLLANLGNFMGGPYPHHSSLHSNPAESESPPFQSQSLGETVQEESAQMIIPDTDEKFDLFGMRQPQEKIYPTHFS